MSVTFGFFDSIDGDRKYSADDFTRFLGNLISDGVIASPSNGLQVQASEGMTVKVTAGWAYIQGHYVHNDTDLYLTLDAPDIARYRADRIVLRFDRINRKIDIAVKNGTVSEFQSVVPSLQRDENIWELSLAWIWTGAGMEAVEQQHIHDERGQTDVCGWVTGLIQQIDTTNLFAQYDSAFRTWFNNLQKDYDSQYICNGINDNVKLPEFLTALQSKHPNITTVRIVGTFGIDDTTEDTGSYLSIVSMWIDNSGNKPITLDFSGCDVIQFTKANTFAMFQNCNVKNLRIEVDCEIAYAIYFTSCIQAENCNLENCHISGIVMGDVFMSYRGLYLDGATDGCQIVDCSIDLTAEESVWGIFSLYNNHFRGGKVNVSAKNATCFNGSGSLTDCTFCAMADENAYGINASNYLFATNCETVGYTKDGTNYDGCGIYSTGAAKVFLNGIRSVASPPDLYTSTNSMRLADGSEGFYTGIFSPLVNVPATVATNQPSKILSQADYDELGNPLDKVLYIIDK